MKTIANAVLGLSLILMSAEAPGIDHLETGEVARAGVEQPKDWCLTMRDWEPHESVFAGTCPLEGTCDDPLVRDGYMLGDEQLFTTVRVFLHVFRQSNGFDAAATPTDVVQAMASLNADFAPFKIRFAYDWQYVDNSAYRQLSTSEIESAKMTYAISPESQCNVYVTGFGGGLATFPWRDDALESTGGLILGENFFGASPSGTYRVFTHEMGHCLGLWHTHHGVDEVGTCGDCYESADGTDGDTVGDFCSDTPPRPINFGLCADPGSVDPCSGTPWGYTMPENFMSYGSGNGGEDGCWTMFTEQQGARMHCWFASVLTGWTACDNGQDCNGNLIADDCDIAEGTSLDVNENGVPDECDGVSEDLDGDEIVGFNDLVILLAQWGPCVGCPADLDGNGIVEFADLVSLLSAWTV